MPPPRSSSSSPSIQTNVYSEGLSCETPLVELRNWAPKGWRVMLKLECLNTTGSNKDRSGKAMVDHAVKQGKLREGMSVVEASSGNASVAIAAAAAGYGCGMTALIPPGMAKDKVDRQLGYGVEIKEVTDDRGNSDPDYRRHVARSWEQEHPDRYHTLDQFANPENPNAHQRGTGAECVHQLRRLKPRIGTLGWFIMGVGTGGTITGVARALRDGGAATDRVRTIAADPFGSGIAAHLRGEQWGGGSLEAPDGIGSAKLPDNLDTAVIDDAITVRRVRALEQIGRLRKLEGLLVGPCTGYALAALLELAEWSDDQLGDQPRTALLLASDRGESYLSDPAVREAVA